MRNTWIVMKKQFKDTLKNKIILIQFVLFPILTLIMERAIHIEGMPELFFTKLFSTMYVGMAPLTAAAAILSEEKEKNTLRVLLMANVKPWEYLLGVGFYIWIICMMGAGAMSVGVPPERIPTYLVLMGIGFLLSIIAGACVGMIARGQMGATSLSVPVMMVLAFVPMLAMFNDKISKIAKIFYTQQLRLCLDTMSFENCSGETMAVVLTNAVLFLGLFIWAYKRKGLE